MAKIIENKKGFKVIEVSFPECIAWGGYGLCDSCDCAFSTGYYIAVLNQVYCPECYEQFKENARYYKSDRMIEEKNFNYMRKLLNI